MSPPGLENNGSLPSFNNPTDAIEMLTADHRRVELLFSRFMNSSPTEYPALALAIFRELKVHSLLEEELFYPALYPVRNSNPMGEIDRNINGNDVLTTEGRGANHDGDLLPGPVVSAYGDHRLMRFQIGQLLRCNVSEADFRQGMVDLQEIVHEHFSIEEAALFPHAELTIDVQALGRDMQKRKAAIIAEAA